MEDDPEAIEAWNNFVMGYDPCEIGDTDEGRQAAYVACLYMNGASNGGINSFFTSCHELGSGAVVESLLAVGALKACTQLRHILWLIGRPIPPSTSDARWAFLDDFWPEAADEYDCLSSEANEELLLCLKRHVREHCDFYLSLNAA